MENGRSLIFSLALVKTFESIIKSNFLIFFVRGLVCYGRRFFILRFRLIDRLWYRSIFSGKSVFDSGIECFWELQSTLQIILRTGNSTEKEYERFINKRDLERRRAGGGFGIKCFIKLTWVLYNAKGIDARLINWNLRWNIVLRSLYTIYWPELRARSGCQWQAGFAQFSYVELTLN